MDAEAKKLAALKEELLKDMEALERVERLIAAKNGSLSRPDERQYQLPISPKPQADLDIDSFEEDEENSTGISIRGKIAEIMNSDPSVRWTTQRVLFHLQAIEFPLKAKKPIYSIGQSLNSLVKQGRIRLIRKGSGSEPNIYKGKAMDAVGESGKPEDHSKEDTIESAE